MKLQTQSKHPQCLLYSFAMCLGVEVSLLEEEVGHDGKDGYHWLEFTQSCLDRGVIPMYYEIYPRSMTETNKPLWPILESQRRATNFIYGYNAVLMTNTHAVAMAAHEGIVYDSKGKMYPFNWKDYCRIIVLIPESNHDE